MAFLALHSLEPLLLRKVTSLLAPDHTVSTASSWTRLRHLVKERPVTAVILDLREEWSGHFLVKLREDFSHLGVVVLADVQHDPKALFRLGRAQVRWLELVDRRAIEKELSGVVSRALEKGTTSQTLERLSDELTGWSREQLSRALDSVHENWKASRYAEECGLTLYEMRRELRMRGLPTPNKLLVWVRMIHASHWLTEKGRSAESVSRQLDYANGAVFRRALRRCVGLTPTEIKSEYSSDDFVMRSLTRSVSTRRPKVPVS